MTPRLRRSVCKLNSFLPHSPGYLAEAEFATVWTKLQHNHCSAPQRLRAFHGWFDALRTRQLLTRVDGATSVDPVEIVAALLAWGSCAVPATPAAQLRLLERLQGGGLTASCRLSCRQEAEDVFTAR